MKGFLATVSVLTFILLLPLFIWSLYSTDRLFKYIQEHHTAIWASLGSPRIKLGREYTASSAPMRFVTQSGYLEIPDPPLHLLGVNAKRSFYVAICTFVVFTLSTLADSVGSEMRWF